jgi:hypothetical protein
MANRIKINWLRWLRLAWVAFIFLYSGLFFYNFFKPFNNWFLAYIYTMILVLWLCVEYYKKHLFFQSGFLPLDQYKWYLRAPFALLFYSSFVIGCATLAWWQTNRIHLYPFIQILGILALLYSIFMRRQAFTKPVPDDESITRFYLSLLFLTISLALGYSSLFVLPYVIIIGYPLIFWQRIYEIKRFKKFEKYVYEEKKINKINTKNYFDLWEAYIDKHSKKRGKQ